LQNQVIGGSAKNLRVRLDQIDLANPVVWLYILTALVATLQCTLGHLKTFAGSDILYTKYNNYVIFKNSFFHLIQNKDLYKFYLTEQWDLYKYSPSFSFLFGALAYLPDTIGLFLWNVLNVIPVLYGLKLLTSVSGRNKSYVLLFCLIESLNSLQNAQSNGLMAGLILLTFVSLENGKYFLATLFVVLSVFLKIYGGIAFVFFIFYPDKRRLILYTLFWFMLIGILPLLVVSLHQLIYLYKSWGDLLKNDQVQSLGISVSGIISSWFNIDAPKSLISLAGMLVFLSPLIRVKSWGSNSFRLMMLCSALIWVVIFNHKAESPTFVIALLGIALWYFSQDKTRVNTILVVLAFILTTLSVSDLTPRFIRNGFVGPYCIKAVMPVIIWCKIIFELWVNKFAVVADKSSPPSFFRTDLAQRSS
jgi:hypothetical protein